MAYVYVHMNVHESSNHLADLVARVHESRSLMSCLFLCKHEKPVYLTPTLSVSLTHTLEKTTGHNVNVSRGGRLTGALTSE